MKILFSADIHGESSPPKKLKMFQQLLEDHHKVAVVNKCRVICYAGDLVNKRYGVRDMVWIILEAAIRRNQEAGIETWLLPGNHDIPFSTRPEDTILKLFKDHSRVFLDPEILEGKDYIIVMMPWREPGAFIYELRAITAEVEAEPRYRGKRKLLVSHIAVKGGKPGPSNFVVDAQVEVDHLYPNVYDWVLLGDFHRHQKLAKNVLYLGAPIEFKHGDCDTVGAWIFNTKTFRLRKSELANDYPRYRTWDLTGRRRGESLVLPGYTDFDYNRIRLHPSIEEPVRELYPDADFLYEVDEYDSSGERLGDVDPEEPLTVWKEFCRVKGLSETHYKVGIKAIQKATNL